MRLKSRHENIPGGFQYTQAETGFEAPKGGSFNVVVEAIRRHRIGNKWLAQKHGWSTDRDDISDELDLYSAKRMLANPAWHHFINDTEGGVSASGPFRFPANRSARSVSAVVGSVAAGVRTLIDFLGSGGRAVERELAEKRARICAACVHNKTGDWTSWFTEPAANAIRLQLGIKNDLKLETTKDSVLGICEICSCNLPLKVWVPLSHVLNNTSEEIMAKFPSHCWIPIEKQERAP